MLGSFALRKERQLGGEPADCGKLLTMKEKHDAANKSKPQPVRRNVWPKESSEVALILGLRLETESLEQENGLAEVGLRFLVLLFRSPQLTG